MWYGTDMHVHVSVTHVWECLVILGSVMKYGIEEMPVSRKHVNQVRNKTLKLQRCQVK